MAVYYNYFVVNFCLKVNLFKLYLSRASAVLISV